MFVITSFIRTRTDEEFTEMYAQGDTMGPFRVDFFKFAKDIKNPTGAAVMQSLPAFLRPLFMPLFALLFDGKLVPVDNDHFLKCCKHNCGNYTFQVTRNTLLAHCTSRFVGAVL
jgi:hypothetical protein